MYEILTKFDFLLVTAAVSLVLFFMFYLIAIISAIRDDENSFKIFMFISIFVSSIVSVSIKGYLLLTVLQIIIKFIL